ncbi:IS30 family transposase [Chitinibacter tainanensis]|uniref:IS30 family transposase n=1 Tax=Chitinibacter tainanensis TaxID=230667 RepID=UPI002355A3D4|nr:IS30 family transposase [Chitinibacter tainanensis]
MFDESAAPLRKEGWSLEQISGVFRGSEYSVSHEWLYQHIASDLRNGRQIKDLRCISERPAEVETCEELGHWEADMLIGSAHQGALGTRVDRKKGLTRIAHVPSRAAAGDTQAICHLLAPLKDQIRSITFDNGKEFSGHARIARRLQRIATLPTRICPGSAGAIRIPMG